MTVIIILSDQIFNTDEPKAFHFIKGFVRINKRISRTWIYSLAYTGEQRTTEDVDNMLSNKRAREPKKRNRGNKDRDNRATIVGVIVLKKPLHSLTPLGSSQYSFNNDSTV